MTPEFIPFEAEALLTWPGLVAALEAGHRLPAPDIRDQLVYRGKDVILDRATWIDGIGALVKVATLVASNPAHGRPLINGVVNLFDDETGELSALVDFHLVTKWKTAADSLLSASRLARPDSRNFLLVGAGKVAGSMIEAYRSHFPGARFSVWSRHRESAERLAGPLGLDVVTDLETAVGRADVICTCTMATDPVVMGAWLRPGQHLDLVGAYRPDMREVDDEAIARARLFVDARATTIHDVGELILPIAAGIITEDDVVADFYDLAAGRFARRSSDEITIAKNAGGAHLDLMTADYILRAWRARSA